MLEIYAVGNNLWCKSCANFPMHQHEHLCCRLMWECNSLKLLLILGGVCPARTLDCNMNMVDCHNELGRCLISLHFILKVYRSYLEDMASNDYSDIFLNEPWKISVLTIETSKFVLPPNCPFCLEVPLYAI